jgi:ABC-type transport system involved in multi-copper enzyme maturation permease subunit
MEDDDLLQGTTIGSLIAPIWDNMTITLGLLIIFIFTVLFFMLFISERDYARNGHWSGENMDM